MDEAAYQQHKLRRCLQQYPLVLPGLTFREVLHESDNAVILLAENTAHLPFAVKRFKFDAPLIASAVLDDFLLTSRALGLLQQRGLVRVLDAGMVDGAIYLRMEYIQGDTLRHHLETSPLPPLPQRLQWFEELLAAVGAMHSLCLLHRDLKPANILVREDGSLALLDFGIESRLLLEAGFLQADEVYCTPYYISPERIMGEDADERSDLYALGVILYELLTGDKPYDAMTLEELLKKHLLAPIPRLPVALQSFQPLLEGLLAKFLDNRLQSVSDVACLLLDAMQQLDRHNRTT